MFLRRRPSSSCWYGGGHVVDDATLVEMEKGEAQWGVVNVFLSHRVIHFLFRLRHPDDSVRLPWTNRSDEQVGQSISPQRNPSRCPIMMSNHKMV